MSNSYVKDDYNIIIVHANPNRINRVNEFHLGNDRQWMKSVKNLIMMMMIVMNRKMMTIGMQKREGQSGRPDRFDRRTVNMDDSRGLCELTGY